MAGREMIRMMTIGISLLALLVRSAGALTTTASDDALDAGFTDPAPTAVTAAAPSAATPAAVAPQAVSPPAAGRTPSLNPLWAIPLMRLSGTRDRPIFSPSRRPAPAAVAEPIAAKAVPPRKREPDLPQLSLVGTIAGGEEGFGIFLDQSTKAAFRLKVGEDYQGWKLLLIRGREVTLQKDEQSAVLSLPQPGAAQPGGEMRLLPVSVDRSALPRPSNGRPGR
jgi:hypothetical protein